MAKTGRKDVYTTHMKPRFKEIVDWVYKKLIFENWMTFIF